MSFHMEPNQEASMYPHAAVRDHIFAHTDIRGWR